MLARSFTLILALTMTAMIEGFGQSPDTLAPKPNELLLVGAGADSKDPSRAALLSAAFLGSGQIYNNKYWKLPFVYGAAAALGYGIHWNDVRYNDTREALFAVRTGNIDPENPLHSFPESTLERETARFRRDRDFLIIGSMLAYFIVIVDAFVDAHLKNFPKEKLSSIELTPSLRQDFGILNSGLALSFKF